MQTEYLLLSEIADKILSVESEAALACIATLVCFGFALAGRRSGRKMFTGLGFCVAAAWFAMLQLELKDHAMAAAVQAEFGPERLQITMLFSCLPFFATLLTAIFPTHIPFFTPKQA